MKPSLTTATAAIITALMIAQIISSFSAKPPVNPSPEFCGLAESHAAQWVRTRLQLEAELAK